MLDPRLRRNGAASARLPAYHEVVARLPPALDADRQETIGRSGALAYYVAGEGSPLLLVHSINAAASAYEMRPLFERMRGSHRVYAVDLPGFGASPRGRRDYSVALYVQAIQDMLDVIAVEHDVSCRVDALALSLGSEFLARAATEAPSRFRTLALVNPTGFENGRREERGAPGATREKPGVHAVLEMPLWSQALFDLLVSRPSIRFFLRRSWGTTRIDEGLVDYAYVTAHQPGARHAPFAFVAGRLFSADIQQVYERLTLPVWMPHGTRGSFNDFGAADRVHSRPNWLVERFDTGAMPHFERAGEFANRYAGFLAAAV